MTWPVMRALVRWIWARERIRGRHRYYAVLAQEARALGRILVRAAAGR